MKNFFSILNNYNDNAKMRKDVDFWSLMKFITALVAFIATFSSKTLFSRVGENITLNVRSDLPKTPKPRGCSFKIWFEVK